MSVEALSNYLTKSAEYKIIDDRLRRHARGMKALFSTVLAEPGSVVFKDAPSQIPYRGTVVHSSDYEASAIVDGATVAGWLDDWRKARGALMDAWQNMPADMRAAAKVPPAAYDRAAYGR